MNAKKLPNPKTVRAAIRASVPDGKLAQAQIKLARIEQNKAPIGGFTEWGKGKGEGVVAIGVPIADDSFGIAIRAHEAAHATHHGKRPRRKPMTPNEAIASQIVDDVNIETIALPEVEAIRPYKRAKLTVAMRELRTIATMARRLDRNAIPNTVATRNAQILASVRALAMLKHYGSASAGEEYPNPEVKSCGKAIKRLRSAIGARTVSAIWEVIQKAKNRRQRARAISMLVAMLETEPPEGVEEEELPERERGGDILNPVTEGDALDGHMRIRDLRPKSVFCAKEKSIEKRNAPNGVIINPTRYVSAIVSGDSNGLFSRRVRQKPGGCVVIDASGSMGATAKNLAQLCELVPTATVAYYSGGSKGHGELVIYAYEGKRYAGALPENSIHGGNAVDLPAVRWLMKHKKPWTLISDLEFCGGVIGAEDIAHVLVERAQMRGELTVHRSLDAAYEAFGGKGPLRNE